MRYAVLTAKGIGGKLPLVLRRSLGMKKNFRAPRGKRVKKNRQRAREQEGKGLQSPGRNTHNPKTEEAEANTRTKIVASGGTAMPRIIDPGAAAQHTTSIL
jgi:hypothetical protein